MRFEARIKNVPENRWGVWDHGAEEWRETMLGTTDEADARQSAEVMNTMPDGYALGVRMRIRRPPRVRLARFLVAVAFGVCAGQVFVPGNWPAIALWFGGAAATLVYVWLKLFLIERYTPDVEIVHMGLDPLDESDQQEESQ